MSGQRKEGRLQRGDDRSVTKGTTVRPVDPGFPFCYFWEKPGSRDMKRTNSSPRSAKSVN